jgi:hypothetical protein
MLVGRRLMLSGALKYEVRTIESSLVLDLVISQSFNFPNIIMRTSVEDYCTVLSDREECLGLSGFIR